MLVALQITYVYDYLTKSCRQHEVIQNHEKNVFAMLDKAKPDKVNVRGLNLVTAICTTLKVSRLPLWRELLVRSRA
jgi:hypothetical protein